MYLVVASTSMELEPISSLFTDSDCCCFLLSGVGPVESAIKLTEYLCRANIESISGVINVGLAGAYPDSGSGLLDICLAENEFFGDIGICINERIVELDRSFSPPLKFNLDKKLLTAAGEYLQDAGIEYRCGNFVTVSSASGTLSRSEYLRDKFGAICENMEGAAIARVCQQFHLPLLELRCTSNMVIDRNDQQWHSEEAVALCCRATQVVMEGLDGA